MKQTTFKIYGTNYTVTDVAPDHLDGFAINNEIVYEEPKHGKFIGYVYLEDGSCVACYHTFSVVPMLIVMVLVLILGLGFVLYLIFGQPKSVAIGDTFLKVSQGKDIVVFNGLPSLDYEANEINLRFVNGEMEATILIEADGIEADPVVVPAGGTLAEYPINSVTAVDGVIDAKLKITTETDEQVYNILLEIPYNMNGPVDGYDGYFENEVILNE